jgi:hypothetical protein
MTILNILSKEEIALFDHPPRFTAEERSCVFSLPAWAEDELAQFKNISQQSWFYFTARLLSGNKAVL